MSNWSVQGNPFTAAETAALIALAAGGGSGASVSVNTIDVSGGGSSFPVQSALGTLILFRNGQYQVAGGVNYTRTGGNISLVNAIQGDEQLVSVIITT